MGERARAGADIVVSMLTAVFAETMEGAAKLIKKKKRGGV